MPKGTDTYGGVPNSAIADNGTDILGGASGGNDLAPDSGTKFSNKFLFGSRPVLSREESAYVEDLKISDGKMPQIGSLIGGSDNSETKRRTEEKRFKNN